MYFDHILPRPHAPSIFKLSLVRVAYVSLGVELAEQGQGSYSMEECPPSPQKLSTAYSWGGKVYFFLIVDIYFSLFSCSYNKGSEAGFFT